MKEILKNIVKYLINYSFFLKIAIFLKYNYKINNYKLDKTNLTKDDLITELMNNKFIKFDVNKIDTADYFSIFTDEVLRKKDKISKVKDAKIGRVLLNSNEIKDNAFCKEILNNPYFINICNCYFDYSYSVKTMEVWWGRPNMKGAGYSDFHFDRNHLKALHFDINLIGMFEGSGAVEVVKLKESLKLVKLWGGEMLEDMDIIREVEKLVKDGKGKKGTVTCYDSMNNLHRGGYNQEKERLILHLVINEDVFWNKENYPLNPTIKQKAPMSGII